MRNKGRFLTICAAALAASLLLAAPPGAFAFRTSVTRHEVLQLFDETRQRPVVVDITVRRDYELKADKGLGKLGVAIVSHGNTVKNTEYSFLASALAERGYLVASIQHDLPTDPPLMTKPGEPFVGRRDVYLRDQDNILFALSELQKRLPRADYDHLTLVGHSNGGDVSMYFARRHPEIVSRVIALDNLRVPYVLNDGIKILLIRSTDADFKADPGVLPLSRELRIGSLETVQLNAKHNDMSDRGSRLVKEQIRSALDRFLRDCEKSDDTAARSVQKMIVNTGGY